MSDLPADLSALAARLATLQPVAGPDRDRTLFEAGRRSAPRPRGWPLATLAISCVALWFGVRPPTVLEHTIVVERPEPPSNSEVYVQTSALPSATQDNYLHLRNTVLRLGVDALPQARSTGAAGPPLSARDYSAVIN